MRNAARLATIGLSVASLPNGAGVPSSGAMATGVQTNKPGSRTPPFGKHQVLSEKETGALVACL